MLLLLSHLKHIILRNASFNIAFYEQKGEFDEYDLR